METALCIQEAQFQYFTLPGYPSTTKSDPQTPNQKYTLRTAMNDDPHLKEEDK